MKKGNTPKERAKSKPAFFRRVGKFFAEPGFFRRIGKFFVGLWRTLVKAALEDLDSRDVFRRMAAAGIWMFLLFVVSWLLSYFLLKEGSFAKTWLVDKFFGVKAPDKWAYWPTVLFVAGKIALHYLVVVVLFVFILNHFRVGKINLSYVFVFAYTLLIGGVVGSSSFAYYARTRLASLITFVRFSLWQLLAFMLAAVATTGLTVFATPGWLQGTWQRVRPLGKPEIRGEDFEVLLYALLILIASSIAEARLIVFYKLHI